MAGPSPWQDVIPEAPLYPRSARLALAAILCVVLALLIYRGYEMSALANRPVEMLPTSPVDLNRATLVELELLPGVGPTLAQRIIDFRRERGGFRCPADLLDVHGIGPVLFEQLQERIAIGPWEQPTEEASANVLWVPKPALAAGTRLDPNRASLEELKQLPGIGPTLAARIVESRRALAYRTAEDLRRVKGIGAKTLEAIRPFLQIDP